MTLHRSLVRPLLAAALSVLTLMLPMRPAIANDYSDVWNAAGEGGWGVTFQQWGNTMFATFFIYGPDNKPIWYVAVMNWDGVGKYSGTLYAERGTYFALPWNPLDNDDPAHDIEQVAGTASFQPSTSNNYQGTLAYTVNNGTAVIRVTKAIQRLTVVPIPLDGVYFGGISDEYAGCTNSGDNKKFFDYFRLQVTQSAGNSAAFSFGFDYDGTNSTLTCTLSGTLTQNGVLYGMTDASYLCSDQTDTGAVLSDIKVTAQGIEGQLFAPAIAGGCHESARFSAARY